MQEAMLYSLKTALIGMTIVFAFLAFLSFLMWVIKQIFAHPFRSPAKDPRASHPTTPAPALPEWLIPAAVVFLTLEEDEKSCTAAPWRPSAAENLHTWLLPGGQEK